MLWLFHRWHLIRRFHPPAERCQGDPVATTEPMGIGRMRVTSPVSKMTFVVDEEYAGGRVFDPITGDPFIIPGTTLEKDPQTREERSAPDPGVAPPVPPQAAKSDLTLRINQPAKRGWFRKG